MKTASAGRLTALGGDRLTGVRREVKYILSPVQAEAAFEAFSERLPVKDTYPETSCYRVSVYLDTHKRRFSAAELRGEEPSRKLRIRDYYHISKGKLAFSDVCFLEAKLRMGEIVEKSRFPVARKRLPSVLNKQYKPGAFPDYRSQYESFEEIRRSEMLMPMFVVHYRRVAFQDDASQLRITFDDQLSYHLVRPDTIHSPNWCRACLPPPFLLEPMWVVEAKSIGGTPTWVDDILHGTKASQFSKFGVGVRELRRRGLL